MIILTKFYYVELLKYRSPTIGHGASALLVDRDRRLGVEGGFTLRPISGALFQLNPRGKSLRGGAFVPRK